MLTEAAELSSPLEELSQTYDVKETIRVIKQLNLPRDIINLAVRTLEESGQPRVYVEAFVDYAKSNSHPIAAFFFAFGHLLDEKRVVSLLDELDKLSRSVLIARFAQANLESELLPGLFEKGDIVEIMRVIQYAPPEEKEPRELKEAIRPQIRPPKPRSELEKVLISLGTRSEKELASLYIDQLDTIAEKDQIVIDGTVYEEAQDAILSVGFALRPLARALKQTSYTEFYRRVIQKLSELEVMTSTLGYTDPYTFLKIEDVPYEATDKWILQSIERGDYLGAIYATCGHKMTPHSIEKALEAKRDLEYLYMYAAPNFTEDLIEKAIELGQQLPYLYSYVGPYFSEKNIRQALEKGEALDILYGAVKHKLTPELEKMFLEKMKVSLKALSRQEVEDIFSSNAEYWKENVRTLIKEGVYTDLIYDNFYDVFDEELVRFAIENDPTPVNLRKLVDKSTVRSRVSDATWVQLLRAATVI